MRLRSILFALLAAALLGSAPAQSTQDDLVGAAKSWLQSSASGDRAALNALVDNNALFTTPAGDVLTRQRLIPDDTSKPVQKLPPMEIEAPVAREYGDTGVVMSKLKASQGPTLNATFVFQKQQGKWKLIAAQLSPK